MSNIFNLVRVGQLNEVELSGVIVQIFDELFSGSFNSGQLTGVFYPLNFNPSGYISNSQTGLFITAGQTGVFLSYNDTRLISTILSTTNPLFYPITNPNNYISTGQTGSFAVLNNNNVFTKFNSFKTINATNVNVSGPLSVSGTFINLGNPAAGYLTDYNNNSIIGYTAVPFPAAVRAIFDDSGNPALSFSTISRVLIDNNDNITLDWENKILSGNWNAQNILINGNPVITNNQTGNFITTLSGITTNYTPSGIFDNFNSESIDWENRILVATGTTGTNYSLNWQYGFLIDTTGINSADWKSRYLYDGNQIALGPDDYGNVSLDWGNRILSGDWNSEGLFVQGNPVLTGSQSGTYITTGQTGNFVTTGELIATGEYLLSLISGTAVGVSSLNSKSGSLNLIGKGNITITNNGQNINISGNTGSLINTFAQLKGTNFFTSTNTFAGNNAFTNNTAFLGSTVFEVIPSFNKGLYISGYPVITSNQTGNLTGVFARLHNPNTFTSPITFNSNILFSNQGLNYSNGIYDASGKPILLVGKLTVGSPATTINYRELYDENQKISITFYSGFRFLNDDNGINSVDYGRRLLSGYWNIQSGNFTKGLFISGVPVGTGNTNINTGQLTGLFYPLNSNPAGYVTSTSGGCSIQVTGSSPLSSGNFSGISGTSVFLSGNYILIAGGGSSNTGQLTSVFYPLNQNPSGYISIYNQSGAYIFSTPVTSGVNQQFITFPTPLGNNPYIIPSFGNTLGQSDIYIAETSGISSLGYWVQYSDTINNTGYVLTTLASLSTNTGLATTVIVQNFTSGFFNGTSGTYIFNTQVTSGIETQFVLFPEDLGNNPYVIPSLGNNLGIFDIYIAQTSGISSSGYWVQYSDITNSTGYILTTLASTSSVTGLATTIIVQNFNVTGGGITGNFLPITGGTVSGNVSILSGLNLSGNLIISGNQTVTGDLEINNILYTNFIYDDEFFNRAIELIGGERYLVYNNFNTVDWRNQRLQVATGSNYISLDWGNRELYDINATTTMEWNDGLLYDTTTGISGIPIISVDWKNRILSGHWIAQNLTTQSGNYLPLSGGTINGNVQLTGNLTITGNVTITGSFHVSGILTSASDPNPSLDINNRILYGGFNVGQPIIDWNNCYFYDEFGNLALNFHDTNRQGLTNDGIHVSIDWQNKVLNSNFGNTWFDWGTGVFFDGHVPSIDYINRVLVNDTGNTIFQKNITLDWQNKILSGNWTAQNFNYTPPPTTQITSLLNIDWSLGDHFYFSLSGFTGTNTGNTTFTFLNTGEAKTIMVMVSNTGQMTCTFPSTGTTLVNWPGGTGGTPVQTTGGIIGASLITHKDIYTFSIFNSLVYGNSIQNY